MTEMIVYKYTQRIEVKKIVFKRVEIKKKRGVFYVWKLYIIMEKMGHILDNF